MADESKFSDKEIEQQRREATSRRKNIDYDRRRAEQDILFAARTDGPEEFQARMTNRGIDMNSDTGRKVMEAYWAIRRELQH